MPIAFIGVLPSADGTGTSKTIIPLRGRLASSISRPAPRFIGTAKFEHRLGTRLIGRSGINRATSTI
jgi:hypothetical protein